MSKSSDQKDGGAGREDTGCFLIGVTGHRDLVGEEEPRTRARVRAALVRLAEASHPLVPRVMTGLAEGADSLVATVALDLGMAVEAVLPMPFDFFQDDFHGAARDVFLGLLGHRNLRVRNLPLAKGAAANGRLDPPARTRQYALLKDHIQRRADVLVALWDGIENGLKGGTGDVVAGYLGGGTGSAAVREVRKDGRTASSRSRLVVWIPVSRRQAAERPGVEDPVFLVSDGSQGVYWRQAEVPEAIRAHWRRLAERPANHDERGVHAASGRPGRSTSG